MVRRWGEDGEDREEGEGVACEGRRAKGDVDVDVDVEKWSTDGWGVSTLRSGTHRDISVAGLELTEYSTVVQLYRRLFPLRGRNQSMHHPPSAPGPV